MKMPLNSKYYNSYYVVLPYTVSYTVYYYDHNSSITIQYKTSLDTSFEKAILQNPSYRIQIDGEFLKRDFVFIGHLWEFIPSTFCEINNFLFSVRVDSRFGIRSARETCFKIVPSTPVISVPVENYVHTNGAFHNSTLLDRNQM